MPAQGKAPTFLAIFETKHYSKSQESKWVEDERNLIRIGMYQQGASGAYRLVAKSEVIEFHKYVKVLFLDLAPFKMTEKEFAFGLRSHHHFGYAGGGGESEWLHLYRVLGSGIDPILSTLMKSTSMTAGEWEEDGTRGHQENDGGTATLAVTKKKTKGCFIWKKESENGSAILKWDGSSYELIGEDPVSNVNVE